MRNEKDDLFDFLGISTYEYSYTTLLARLFNNLVGQEWARELFKRALCSDVPDGQITAVPQLHVPRKTGRRADRLDLVLTFGEPVTDIWIIEAKVKSGESSNQLQRYESGEATDRIVKSLEEKLNLGEIKLGKDGWHYSYLTLEGEKPVDSKKFCPVTYESLLTILPADPDLAYELLPAYNCLRSRLDDYYKARAEVLNVTALSNYATLEDYLNDTRGLIDDTNRFHWLINRVAKEIAPALDVELQTTPIVVQNQGFANPGGQIRGIGWQSDVAYDIDTNGPPLEECFDIHFELQLENKKIEDEGKVTLVLHYESNPYKSGLNKEQRIPEPQRQAHWQRRKQFALALNADNKPQQNGWKVRVPQDWSSPPPSNYVNQLAKFSDNFDLGDTVNSFQDWLRDGIETMFWSVENARKRNPFR